MTLVEKILWESLDENIILDIEKGDEILTGRFKNHKVTVKDIDKDEHGMPLVNGKQITKIRIPKLNEAKVYPFNEDDINYTEDDDSLLSVEYSFKTEENEYKVSINSFEDYGIFEVAFGVDNDRISNALDTQKMTGEGQVYSIVATVATIINKFYSKYAADVKRIRIEGTDDKRKNVYQRLFPKYLSPEVMQITKFL